MANIKFLVSPSRRLILLLLTYIAGLIITCFANYVIVGIGGGDKALAMMRIGVVVQDLFMLIIPAIATAMIVTRQSASLLALDAKPGLARIAVAIGVLIVSSPLMNVVIALNESIKFPESMAGFEATIRAMETSAANSVEFILGPHNIGNLIISLLIVGVLAGLSEEIFFRGALQRLLSSSRLSTAGAIWTAAIVFSALHFQFFGFVPRMLLGAYFGYLLVWSGSIWLPIAAHAFNNIMFIVLRYTTGNGDLQLGTDTGYAWLIITIASICTVAGIAWLYKTRIKIN